MVDERCEICGVTADESATGRLIIDHCHSTGLIRGMLCDLCNAYIGDLEHCLLFIKGNIPKRRLWYDSYMDKISLYLGQNKGTPYRRRKQWRRLNH
jgi:hypothetical protein